MDFFHNLGHFFFMAPLMFCVLRKKKTNCLAQSKPQFSWAEITILSNTNHHHHTGESIKLAEFDTFVNIT